MSKVTGGEADSLLSAIVERVGIMFLLISRAVKCVFKSTIFQTDKFKYYTSSFSSFPWYYHKLKHRIHLKPLVLHGPSTRLLMELLEQFCVKLFLNSEKVASSSSSSSMTNICAFSHSPRCGSSSSSTIEKSVVGLISLFGEQTSTFSKSAKDYFGFYYNGLMLKNTFSSEQFGLRLMSESSKFCIWSDYYYFMHYILEYTKSIISTLC